VILLAAPQFTGPLLRFQRGGARYLSRGLKSPVRARWLPCLCDPAAPRGANNARHMEDHQPSPHTLRPST
jgi:hypothetical protein